jgi:hypothetical protein
MSAISPSFDQRSSAAKSALADVRSFVEEINAALVEFLGWFAGNRGTPNS